MKIALVIPLLYALLLTSCAVGKNYQPPKIALQSVWTVPITLKPEESRTNNTTDLPIQEKSSNDLPWWQHFNDAILTDLIGKALRGNYDLKVAQARIMEAGANKDISFSTLLPQIDGTASATREKSAGSLINGLDSLSRAGVNGTWEIDLFGGGRRRLEAAKAGLQAVLSDYEQTQLILVSEVARNYIRLRASQQQYVITQKNLEIQQETLRITEGQRNEGVISDLDVIRAKAQVEATQARLPQIETAIASYINHLNILTGEQPGTLNALLREPQLIPGVPPSLVVATPLQVISGRPDVKAAERRLAEATALDAAALADFFPKLTLQGFFGVQDSALYGGASPWSAAATALMPLLNFGKLSAQADAADARQQQALYSYTQTVLLALEETENGLSAYLNELSREKSLTTVAQQQAVAASIALEQYKAGISAQIDLLTAERNRLDAENDVVISKQTVAENLIGLYRALGEPWQVPPLQEDSAYNAQTSPTSSIAEAPALPVAAQDASPSVMIFSDQI